MVYILLINREWGHYREISDRGLDVLTKRLRGQYIKAEVWDFPVMTERTRLRSYLLYGLFSAILEKNTIKTPEVIFLNRLHALRLSSSLIPKKKYLSFCFQDANYAYATRQGILTKIRACEHLQKFGEHEQASTHLIFASNSSKGQILRALSNWMEPFDTPSMLS